MNAKIYERSMKLAEDLGYDLSDDAIIEQMKLPPIDDWKNDKKLHLFISPRETLLSLGEHDAVHKLDLAIKCSRSGAKASIRGHLMEKMVMDLAKQRGCEVQRNIRMPNVGESIDHTIKISNGKELRFMCQVDLWSGGAQVNRAEKYLKNNHQSFICIVYNQYKQPKQTKKNKKSQELHGWISDAYLQKKLMWLADLDDYLKDQNVNKS